MGGIDMTRRRLLAVPLAAAAVAVAAAGCGGETGHASPVAASSPASAPAASPSAPAAPVSDQDRTWLRDTRQADLAEIAAGRMAQRKGTTPQVTSLGAMLVQDHTAADRKLAATASRLGVELPYAPSNVQTQQASELERGSGRSFDRDWLNAMIGGHEKAIAQTRTEIAKGSSPDVKNLAAGVLPVLQKHLSGLQSAQGG
jgi:putative membrane protein